MHVKTDRPGGLYQKSLWITKGLYRVLKKQICIVDAPGRHNQGFPVAVFGNIGTITDCMYMCNILCGKHALVAKWNVVALIFEKSV